MNTNVPRPRLCHLRRWPHFNGFGFNLHAERNKVGQFIGKVDPGSPAESAGLREHDRIIEVNYCPISNDSHKQVVQRIKDGVERGDTRNTDEVVLLVLDAAAWDYYNRKGIMPKSNDPNVEHLEAEDHGKPRTPEAPPSYKSTIDTEKPATVRPSTPIQREQPVAHYRNVTDFTGPTVTKTSEVRETLHRKRRSAASRLIVQQKEYLLIGSDEESERLNPHPIGGLCFRKLRHPTRQKHWDGIRKTTMMETKRKTKIIWGWLL